MSTLIELDKQIANLHEQLVKLVDEHEQLERGSDACATNTAELGAVIKVLVKRLKARTTITGKFQKWWFTFGLCHESYPDGCYTVFEGTYMLSITVRHGPFNMRMLKQLGLRHGS